ncbi:MAG: hypothetical protein ACSHXZ_02990 [Gammaproteobacteria bacterium]
MRKISPARLRTLVLALALFGLTACSDPFLYFAGGRLSGTETPLVEWPEESGVLQIETLASDPYSVNIGFVLLDGKLYIDPAQDRQWYQNILIDPTVRIRFNGSDLVHPMLTVRETDPATLAQFDPQRIILKLEPVNAPEAHE